MSAPTDARSEPLVYLSARVPKSLRDHLQHHAVREGRPVAALLQEAVRQLLACDGTPEASPVQPPRTALYRHFDSRRVLLYVGIADSLEGRTRDHERDAEWFRYAESRTVEWYDEREVAEAAERHAIRTERPVFNRQCVPDTAQEARRAWYADLVGRPAPPV